MVECGEEPDFEEEELDKDESQRQTLVKRVLSDSRHLEIIRPYPGELHVWRLKDRMKTVSVALVLCLNIPVDPPDVVKLQPCARLEAWIDPQAMPARNAIENISNNLQKAYEIWQPKARYRCSRDPTIEEIKKLCMSLRRNAKEERVLFHYNGHGVPRPSDNGEIWVFNPNYTQYVPLYIYDLQKWMGTPSIYVYDCSHAGKIVNLFKTFSNQDDGKCIQLAACGERQLLPMNPDLPADLFTSCLTTPVKMAIKYYFLQNKKKFLPGLTYEMIDKIPGQFSDRRSMLGELNWIFTAITDTIAWNTLPRDLFQKLFRQDLLVASLFRNFLLAQRVMRSYNCTPMSSPSLPSTHQHQMWGAWDLALELSLSQLPRILELDDPASAYRPSPFFEEQLTAFQVWLGLGSITRSPPEQLPIVLQVLLSQVYRPRALELLGHFLGLGPWAVDLVLKVGIFPYILKLLQSTAEELRPLLTLLWAKILTVDPQCKADLVRENGNRYFAVVLKDASLSAEHRTMAAFVMCSLVSDCPDGATAALNNNILPLCLELLLDPHPPLRQWATICAARTWDQHPRARWEATRDNAPDKLGDQLDDPIPEVRAATAYALGTFIKSLPLNDQSDQGRLINHKIAVSLRSKVIEEGSPLVRQEIVVALHYLILFYETSFREVVKQYFSEYRKAAQDPLISGPNRLNQDNKPIRSLSHEHLYLKVWKAIVQLENDPYPQVATLAKKVTAYVRDKVRGATPVRGVSTSQEEECEQFVTPVITTEFWEWSANYFMKTNELINHDHELTTDPTLAMDGSTGSLKSLEYEEKWTLGLQKLDEQKFIIRHRQSFEVNTTDSLLFHPTDPLLFHPTDPLLVLGREQFVTVWDIEKKTQVNFWENANKRVTVSSRISSMVVLNPGTPSCYLCLGDSDGCVRVWAGAFRPLTNSCPFLVTAFNALRENDGSCLHNANMVMSWEQSSSCLVVAGNSDKIRLWDLDTEQKFKDIPTKGSAVTAIHFHGSWIAAGFSDGYLRLFDRRNSSPIVREWKDHSFPILTTQLFNSSSTSAHIISGASSGEVRLSDLRRNGSVQVRQPGLKIQCMSCHPKAHLFALGTNSQQISVYHTSGSFVNSIRYYNGIMGQKIGPVSSLSFHPSRVLLASSTRDGIVTVHGLTRR